MIKILVVAPMRTRCAESLVKQRQPLKDWRSSSGRCSSRSWSGVRRATPLRRRWVEGACLRADRGQLGAQPRPRSQADHLQCRTKGCSRVRSVHIWSRWRLLGDRLPLALHVDPFVRVGIDPKLRGRAAVREHRLARLKGTTVAWAVFGSVPRTRFRADEPPLSGIRGSARGDCGLWMWTCDCDRSDHQYIGYLLDDPSCTRPTRDRAIGVPGGTAAHPGARCVPGAHPNDPVRPASGIVGRARLRPWVLGDYFQ